MVCTNTFFLRILFYLNLVIQIIRFIVPICLIVKIGFDFYQNMLNNDANFAKERLRMSMNRIVAAVIVFLVPTFINLFISLVENIVGIDADYQSCMTNIKNIAYYEELEVVKEKLLEDSKNEYYLQMFEELKALELIYIQNHQSSNLGTDATGSIVGQKYNLTETQLQNIAKVCQREQDSAIGSAAEASLMANRFELFGSKYGSGANGLYNYIMNSNWWAPAKKGTYKSVNLKPEILNAVREVLIYGQRTLPLYIDEHDWVGDLSKIVTNGKTYTSSSAFKNHDNYVKDVTIIYNKMSAVYTYYTHPTSTSDPFGYTKKAKNKIDTLNK